MICVHAGHLDEYFRKIRKLHVDYGSRLWPFLYQPESRARTDVLNNYSETLFLEAVRACDTGGSTSFDPENLCDSSWQQMMSDVYWQHDVDRALLPSRVNVHGQGAASGADFLVGGLEWPYIAGDGSDETLHIWQGQRQGS